MNSLSRRSTLAEMQRSFVKRHSEVGFYEPAAGTVVVIPSLTLRQSDLRKVTGIQFYEERLLCFVLALARPEVRVVYVTSVTVDPAIIEYYLTFLPDQEGARERLHLIALDDPAHRPLTHKLIERPDVMEHVRWIVGEPSDAWLLPF